jgi:hypothetical protein
MKFTVQVGNKESQVDFQRDPWTGSVRISVEGHTVVEQSGPAMWFGLMPVRRYEFHAESHDVVVEHERPLFFASFRPHDYRVFVDGRIIHKQHGY